MPKPIRRSRDTETRKALKRPEGWIPPNALPTDIYLGDGVRCRWIRKFINGAIEDRTNYFRRLRRGWVAVTKEEAPAHLQGWADEAGHITQGGLILCKIDADIADLDVQYFEQMASGAAANAMSEFTAGADSRMPKFNESARPKVLRGSAPVGAV